jgi:hypothetical protein
MTDQSTPSGQPSGLFFQLHLSRKYLNTEELDVAVKQLIELAQHIEYEANTHDEHDPVYASHLMGVSGLIANLADQLEKSS